MYTKKRACSEWSYSSLKKRHKLLWPILHNIYIFSTFKKICQILTSIPSFFFFLFLSQDKTFYVAKIKSYDSDDGPNGKHLVKYELDGKEEALDLDVETIFMCEPSPNDLKNMERDDKKKNSKKKKTSHEKGNEEE